MCSLPMLLLCLEYVRIRAHTHAHTHTDMHGILTNAKQSPIPYLLTHQLNTHTMFVSVTRWYFAITITFSDVISSVNVFFCFIP